MVSTAFAKCLTSLQELGRNLTNLIYDISKTSCLSISLSSVELVPSETQEQDVADVLTKRPIALWNTEKAGIQVLQQITPPNKEVRIQLVPRLQIPCLNLYKSSGSCAIFKIQNLLVFCSVFFSSFNVYSLVLIRKTAPIIYHISNLEITCNHYYCELNHTWFCFQLECWFTRVWPMSTLVAVFI